MATNAEQFAIATALITAVRHNDMESTRSILLEDMDPGATMLVLARMAWTLIVCLADTMHIDPATLWQSLAVTAVSIMDDDDN